MNKTVAKIDLITQIKDVTNKCSVLFSSLMQGAAVLDFKFGVLDDFLTDLTDQMKRTITLSLKSKMAACTVTQVKAAHSFVNY